MTSPRVQFTGILSAGWSGTHGERLLNFYQPSREFVLPTCWYSVSLAVSEPFEQQPKSYSLLVIYQKLEHIHDNPVNAGFCSFPNGYKYSSASFNETIVKEWFWLNHIDK